MGLERNSPLARCLAEVVGTFLLVFFGCGAVHVAVLTGALNGLWQVAIVWGIGVMVAAYVVGDISGAHINPAITIALAAWGRFPWREVAGYIVSQLVGAFLAAAVLFVVYAGWLAEKENQLGVTRGGPGSEVTASCYGEFYPNPGKPEIIEAYKKEDVARLNGWTTTGQACLLEVVGTLVLAVVVFAVTDERNKAAPAGRMAPLFIGLTVAALISVMAPMTQACLNPGRDFGPRLFTAVAGWGAIALPGIRSVGTILVYALAPVVGAVAGGALYTHVLQPLLAPVIPPGRVSS